MLIDCSKHPNFDGHEEVHRLIDEETGLNAFLSIHRTGTWGVAGGGCRIWPYESEDAALRNVLRLSQDMTYKLALAGLGAGGAKCVLIGDSSRIKSRALLQRLGEEIHELQGRFVVGGDVGTNADDLKVIATRTPYVELGSFGRDTVSEATAHGVYWAIVAALCHAHPGVALNRIRVAIQGMGKVGAQLARLLAREGASLVVSDVDAGRALAVATELGATRVSPTEILESEADVFAPCALGDVLTPETIARLRCSIVAGSANNQLEDPAAAGLLVQRGITYVPDFVANLGGTLAGAKPHACRDAASVSQLTGAIRDITLRVLETARTTGVSSQEAALELAHRTETERAQRSRAIVPWFRKLWRMAWFARLSLRLRNFFEELRGRWAYKTRMIEH